MRFVLHGGMRGELQDALDGVAEPFDDFMIFRGSVPDSKNILSIHKRG